MAFQLFSQFPFVLCSSDRTLKAIALGPDGCWSQSPGPSSDKTCPSQIWNPELVPLIAHPAMWMGAHWLSLALGSGVNYLLIIAWVATPTPSDVSSQNGWRCSIIANSPDLSEASITNAHLSVLHHWLVGLAHTPGGMFELGNSLHLYQRIDFEFSIWNRKQNKG